MTKRIIYKTPDGGVAVIIPSEECGLTVEEIALKDVPFGEPFKILDVRDIPSDRTFRLAWDVDIADLIDGFGAEYSSIDGVKE